MAWEKLPTNYTDAVWNGLKRYQMVNNDDGTVSFRDVTAYEHRENSFFGSKDANAMNEAINNVMSIGVRGENLLHNWCFVNPVNRRGQDTYTKNTATELTIDRWLKGVNVAVTILENRGVQVTETAGGSSNVFFSQRLSGEELVPGQSYTVSFLTEDNELATGTFVYTPPTSTAANVKYVDVTTSYGSVQFTWDAAAGKYSMFAGVVGSKSVVFVAAKLELGSVQTLAREGENGEWVLLDIPNYADQYAICAQYDLTTGEHLGCSPIEANAGNHNSIYRGKYLGEVVTEAQYAAISAGTFDDLYIGDYWTIGGVNYRIAAFDYYYMRSDVPLSTHHVTLVPDKILYNHEMNDENDTTGAYGESKMRRSGLTQAKDTIKDAFGSDHLLMHRLYFNNAVTDGHTSGGSWYDSTLALMTEQNVYGCRIYSDIANNGSVSNRVTLDFTQYPLFALYPRHIHADSIYWLRDVVSSSRFADVDANGLSNSGNASYSRGVRPAFSIKA